MGNDVGLGRLFTVWFTPNMEMSGVFIGTLGVVLGLGFGLGLAAIVIGVILGTIPVALLSMMGPKTGMGQLPLARLPFGKTIALPALVQYLSAIGWIGLGAFFGAQAGHLLFHIPFWGGALLVLLLEGSLSIFGYEYVQQAEKFGAFVMGILFVILSIRIFQHHVVLPQDTVHGWTLVAAFVSMVTIALSSAFSWASYASDYSRYLKPNSPPKRVFWYTFGGLGLSYLWILTIGLAAASVLNDQTAGGVRSLVGGGVGGDIALLSIIFAEVVSCAMNDYSASLSFQSIGVKVKRPIISAAVVALSFALILWMNEGNLSTKFTNILLFTAYWLAPFCAIVMIDWHYNKSKYTPAYLVRSMRFRNLSSGWPAFVSFVIGFAVMVPFMDTSEIVGTVAHSLKGADTAFFVGFIVTSGLYYTLRRISVHAESRVTEPKEARAVTTGILHLPKPHFHFKHQ